MIFGIKSNRVGRTYRGGSRIDAFTGEKPPNIPGKLFPEDWTASVTEAAGGEHLEGVGVTEDGISLRDIVGKDEYPILVKLLNSDERLVIQAHPTVEFAKKHLGCGYGKTECWYFLDCDENACVYLGFSDGVTREKWKAAFESGDNVIMLSMLRRFGVSSGDFIFVDGGIPHAIGGGCFMIELQEPSDLMVAAERFTPSGRRIPDYKIDMGMGEELMLNVYDYTPRSESELRERYMKKPKPVSDGVREILGSDVTDKFSMYELSANGSLVIPRRYAAAIVTCGKGSICGRAAKRGDRFLIKDENNITAEGDADFSVVVCF